MENRERERCSICFEDQNHTSTTLPCTHEFHEDCIGTAYRFQNHYRCPLCRQTPIADWFDTPVGRRLGRMVESPEPLLAIIGQTIASALDSTAIAIYVSYSHASQQFLVNVVADLRQRVNEPVRQILDELVFPLNDSHMGSLALLEVIRDFLDSWLDQEPIPDAVMHLFDAYYVFIMGALGIDR